jgi:hypothetical protein
MDPNWFQSLEAVELQNLIEQNSGIKLSQRSQNVSKPHNKVIHCMIHSIFYPLTPTLTD